MSTGTALMERILRALSSAGLTVWRNTTAMGWAGRSFPLRRGDVYRAKGGERVVIDAYPIRAGLCEGSSDIVGFQSIVVTPAMVGRKIAIFGSWEVKDGTGRLTRSQSNYIEHVAENGGIAAVVRSEEAALHTIIEG